LSDRTAIRFRLARRVFAKARLAFSFSIVAVPLVPNGDSRAKRDYAIARWQKFLPFVPFVGIDPQRAI